MSTRLFLSLPLAIFLATLHALPFAPRPDRLFGVAVPPEARHGNRGLQAVRSYETHLIPWTAAALVASLFLPLSWAIFWLPLASLLSLAVAGRIFSGQRSEMRRFGFATPSTREAPLTDHGDGLLWKVLPFAIPFAILAGTALYLRIHWDQIPVRFPVHWAANGSPNGWSTRSSMGVYGPLLLGACAVCMVLAIFVFSSWGSRRSAQPAACQIVPLVVAYVVATAFSVAGLLALHAKPLWGLLVFHAAAIGLLAVAIRHSLRRREPSGARAGEITPDACWHGDQFYYNPQDPALFVEKRIGVGLTLNFGNRMSWVFLGAVLLCSAGLAFFALRITPP